MRWVERMVLYRVNGATTLRSGSLVAPDGLGERDVPNRKSKGMLRGQGNVCGLKWTVERTTPCRATI